jgi:predicted nuclease of predicted toxin-antitoxin system
VRVLLDECVPRRLKRDLVGHEVRTAPEMGWAGKRNGELLSVAQDSFDVLLTVDGKLQLEQRLTAFHIAVVVLQAVSNRLGDLQPLIPEVLSQLPNARPGQALVVSGPRRKSTDK